MKGFGKVRDGESRTEMGGFFCIVRTFASCSVINELPISTASSRQLSRALYRQLSKLLFEAILAKVDLLSYQCLLPLAADVIPCRSRVSLLLLFLPFPFLLGKPDAEVAS